MRKSFNKVPRRNKINIQIQESKTITTAHSKNMVIHSELKLLHNYVPILTKKWAALQYFIFKKTWKPKIISCNKNQKYIPRNSFPLLKLL
jgi:hypothetical protein